MSDDVLLALLVTLAAGLCTSIGSAIAFFTKTTNRVFLTLALGFSAGVMIYVSFVEIVPIAGSISTQKELTPQLSGT